MRILRLIYEWPPPWIGLAPAPYEITQAQVKLGHTFDVFCARWPNAGDSVRLDKVNLHTIWRAPFYGTVALTSSVILFFKYLSWRRKNEVDIIHSHGHFGIWIYVYRVFLEKYFPWVKEMNTPLIAHFHNTVKGRKEKLEDQQTDIKLISRYLDWPLAELSDRFAIKAASAYVFVSEELKNEAIKYYKADPSKCFVVNSGVNTNSFKPASPTEKAKTRIEIKLEPQDKLILNIGAIVERKNVLLLVQALEYLPKNYKLMLVGSGDVDYLDKINLYSREKKVSERIIRVDYTPYPDLPIAYQAADLFILPSSFEGMPKVVLESLACGTQVLGSGFKLEDDLKGIEYVEKLEPKMIAEQIKDMIQKPRTVDIYKIMKYYSWDVIVKKYEDIYHHVIQNYRI